MSETGTRDVFVLLPLAARTCSAVVEQVDAWDAPTPCAGWDVRDVLNHLVSEHLWAPRLLAGESLDDVGDAFDGDLLGDDPAGAWRAAIAASLLAWAAAGETPDAPVATSMGPLPTREYATQMLLDLTVHAWDLARGAGVPLALPEETVALSLDYARERLPAEGVEGLFAPAVEADAHDPAGRLLARLGRDPR